MNTSTDDPNRKRHHIWEALAEQLRRQPRKLVFVSSEEHGCANPFTLAAAVRGGLRREGLIVSIQTSFEENGVYVGLGRFDSAIKQREARKTRNTFLLRCRDALKRRLNRHFDIGVRIASGGGKVHMFDLATPERDIIVKCKTFKTRYALSARIARLRQAVLQLDGIGGNPTRLLITDCNLDSQPEETLGQRFVRLNHHLLQRVAVLELPRAGGELVCIHGNLGW